MKKTLLIFLIVAFILGVAGAVLSIGMVISAISFMEWGRVILYSVTAIACAEMAVLGAMKLRNREKS